MRTTGRSEQRGRWARVAHPLVRAHVRDRERDLRDAEAHERTGRVLLGLSGDRWRVVDNFAHRSGSRAQIVVGRPGLFLIVARKPDGCVRVKDGVPWQRHGPDAQTDRPNTQINRNVLEPADALRREIHARTGRWAAVHAVVVLWSEFPQHVAETSRITFVQGRDLAEWLRRRPVELDAEAHAEIAQSVLAIADEGPRRGRRAPHLHQR